MNVYVDTIIKQSLPVYLAMDLCEILWEDYRNKVIERLNKNYYHLFDQRFLLSDIFKRSQRYCKRCGEYHKDWGDYCRYHGLRNFFKCGFVPDHVNSLPDSSDLFDDLEERYYERRNEEPPNQIW